MSRCMACDKRFNDFELIKSDCIKHSLCTYCLDVSFSEYDILKSNKFILQDDDYKNLLDCDKITLDK